MHLQGLLYFLGSFIACHVILENRQIKNRPNCKNQFLKKGRTGNKQKTVRAFTKKESFLLIE